MFFPHFDIFVIYYYAGPQQPGIYLFHMIKGEMLYVGRYVQNVRELKG